MAAKVLKIALVQLAVGPNKIDNISRAKQLVKAAAQKGANIISLPECFNCPYGTQYFAKYAEQIPGQSTNMLSALAKELQVYIVGGSIPEEDGGKYFNTCAIFSPDGKMVAKHRKVAYCKVGVGICYDIRFSEMAQLYGKQGCKLLFYPGAFNMTTGPAHWELLIRSRALDNQVYVATVSPARDEGATYVAWGHTTVASPWGEVIAQCQHQEEVLYAQIDLNHLDEVRSQIPIISQKRPDLYSVEDNKLSRD